MRRVSSIALVALLVLVGCGGSSGPSESSFKKSYSSEKAKLKKLGEDVGQAVEGAAKQNDGTLVKEFEGLAGRATTLAGELGQLQAPTKFRTELASLQSSITQVAGTLRQIEAAAAANDESAAKAGGEAIVADSQQVKAIDDALSKKLGLPSTP